MDFGFTFFEVSVLVRRTAAPLSAGKDPLFQDYVWFRENERFYFSKSSFWLSSWRSGDLYSMSMLSMSRQRGNSRHLFAPSSVLLFVMDDLDFWKTWGTLLVPQSITVVSPFPNLESAKISSKMHGVPAGNPGESNFYRGNLIVYPCTSWTPLLLVLSSHESRTTDDCFDCTKLRTMLRIACALHSLARDGHWYTPAICVLKIVWSCLVIQFCTFLDMKSGGWSGLEGEGLAKHPQGLQQLRVIYHRSGVLQSVEVAVKETDELRRMAGWRISLCWN